MSSSLVSTVGRAVGVRPVRLAAVARASGGRRVAPALVLVVALLVGCRASGSGPSGAELSLSTRERLAVLTVDDRPRPDGRYRRDDWPHWEDVDGDGCDARQQALLVWSVSPPSLAGGGRCKVASGRWVSPYDGLTSTEPLDVDVDHLVPLAEAFRSGGWRWDASRRRAFANDQSELVVASRTSNSAKGSSPPDEWRPPIEDSWCAYADGWVAVKATWGLTVTTRERDALGQMLDTCGPEGPVWPLQS